MKRWSIMAGFCLSVFLAAAQGQWNSESPAVWKYDLNAKRGAALKSFDGIDQTENIWHKTPREKAITYDSPNGKPQWFPETSGEGSRIQVRANAAVVAKYTLLKNKENNAYGSLKIDATNGFHKFIIRDIDATKVTDVAKYSFTLKTHYKDGNGQVVYPSVARSFYLVFGSNTTGLTRSAATGVGSVFRGGAGINTTDAEPYSEAIFTTLRLPYVVNKPHMAFSYRKVTKKYTHTDGTGKAVFAAISSPNASFQADGTSHQVELYCNNSDKDQYYTAENTSVTVKPQTFHLWIDGNKIGEYDIANAGEASISTGKPLDSFMVYTSGKTDETGELGYGAIELGDFKIDYVSATKAK